MRTVAIMFGMAIGLLVGAYFGISALEAFMQTVTFESPDQVEKEGARLLLGTILAGVFMGGVGGLGAGTLLRNLVERNIVDLETLEGDEATLERAMPPVDAGEASRGAAGAPPPAPKVTEPRAAGPVSVTGAGAAGAATVVAAATEFKASEPVISQPVAAQAPAEPMTVEEVAVEQPVAAVSSGIDLSALQAAVARSAPDQAASVSQDAQAEVVPAEQAGTAMEDGGIHDTGALFDAPAGWTPPALPEEPVEVVEARVEKPVFEPVASAQVMAEPIDDEPIAEEPIVEQSIVVEPVLAAAPADLPPPNAAFGAYAAEDARAAVTMAETDIVGDIESAPEMAAAGQMAAAETVAAVAPLEGMADAAAEDVPAVIAAPEESVVMDGIAEAAAPITVAAATAGHTVEAVASEAVTATEALATEAAVATEAVVSEADITTAANETAETIVSEVAVAAEDAPNDQAPNDDAATEVATEVAANETTNDPKPLA